MNFVKLPVFTFILPKNEPFLEKIFFFFVLLNFFTSVIWLFVLCSQCAASYNRIQKTRRSDIL